MPNAKQQKASVTRDNRARLAWLMFNQQLMSLEKIAPHVGVKTKGAVSKMISDIESVIASEFLAEVRSIRVSHTFRLEAIFEQAIKSFERSKENSTSITVKKTSDGDETTQTAKGQCGDARFLSEARGALEQIREIWAANVPPKTIVDEYSRVEHEINISVDGQRSRLAAIASRLGVGIVVNALPTEGLAGDSQPTVGTGSHNGQHANGHGPILPT